MTLSPFNFPYKLKNMKNEFMFRKKRLKDKSLLDIEEEINKLKNIIDDEINRRIKNLNEQEIKQR